MGNLALGTWQRLGLPGSLEETSARKSLSGGCRIPGRADHPAWRPEFRDIRTRSIDFYVYSISAGLSCPAMPASWRKITYDTEASDL